MEVAMFSLATFVFFAGGQPTYSVVSMQTEKACWAAARAYVHQEPQDVATGAIALGAGCVVRGGRPS